MLQYVAVLGLVGTSTPVQAHAARACAHARRALRVKLRQAPMPHLGVVTTCNMFCIYFLGGLIFQFEHQAERAVLGGSLLEGALPPPSPSRANDA